MLKRMCTCLYRV